MSHMHTHTHTHTHTLTDRQGGQRRSLEICSSANYLLSKHCWHSSIQSLCLSVSLSTSTSVTLFFVFFFLFFFFTFFFFCLRLYVCLCPFSSFISDLYIYRSPFLPFPAVFVPLCRRCRWVSGSNTLVQTLNNCLKVWRHILFRRSSSGRFNNLLPGISLIPLIRYQ